MFEEGQSISSLESRQAWTRPEPPKRLILLSPSGDFNGSAQLQNFFSLGMRVDLNNFWWTWEPTRRTFEKKWRPFFFGRKKFRIHNPKFSVCEFGIFFLQKKKVSIFLKVRRVGSQVHQKLFKSARIPSDKKLFGFLLGSACSRVPCRRAWGYVAVERSKARFLKKADGGATKSITAR